MTKSDFVNCPHCGEEIKRSATACRHCGSDDNTGWSEDTYLDGVELPEAGQYEDGLEEEGFRTPKMVSSRWFIGAVAIFLIGLFVAWLLRQVHF